jgi:probable rRNA maturation factor
MIITNLFIGSRFAVNRKMLRATVERVLATHGVEDAQVDVSVVGKRKIKELNESKLQHQGETDVLSFPQHERHQLEDFPMPSGMPPHLGDVVISFPEAVQSAKRFGKLVDEQLCFYLEHALLHLLGYHHD